MESKKYLFFLLLTIVTISTKGEWSGSLLNIYNFINVIRRGEKKLIVIVFPTLILKRIFRFHAL